MAVAVEPVPHAAGPRAGAHRQGLRPVFFLQCAAALAAIAGMALVLYFGVAPVRITDHDRVAVTQAGGEEGSRLTLTGETAAATQHVTCVPYLQFDSSSDQHPACQAKVHGRLGGAFAGLLLFVAGSALWVGSHGDRALGLSERRPLIRSSLS